MPSNLFSRLAKLLDPEIRAKNMQALRLEARERYYGLAHPAMPDPVFVIGCSRSGTTVTFETIAASGHFLHFDYELPQFWNG
ncbi:MAG: sulfotransferase, partial [Propionivibrio sp.]|nr:sulfotransferase [Propionivibrio sp.]